jgi:hypothetical protein
VHVAGIDNRVPDYLSRWHTKRSFEALFWNEMVKVGKVHLINEVQVPLAMLYLENDW